MTWTSTSSTLQLVFAIVAIVICTVLMLAATRHPTRLLHDHPRPTTLHCPVMETSTAQGTLVLGNQQDYNNSEVTVVPEQETARE